MTRFFVRFVVTAEWSPDEALTSEDYDSSYGSSFSPEPHNRRHTGELSIPVQAWSAEEATLKLEKKLEDLCK